MSCSSWIWLGTSLLQLCLRVLISKRTHPYNQVMFVSAGDAGQDMGISFAMLFCGTVTFFPIYA